MKLYFTPGACSLVIRIILNEIGCDVQYESVDLRAKKTESGNDFLSINPKGSVPALTLNDGQILTENAVILQYLADTYPAAQLLPSVGNFQRYRVLEWLNFITTELHKGIGILFNPAITPNLRSDIFEPLILRKLTYIDQALSASTYVSGDSFTLPDAYLFVMLRWIDHLQIDRSGYKHLARYQANLQQRPAIQNALAQEKLQ